MSGLRAQLAWMLRGRAHTTAALDSLSSDLRELQAKTSRLEAAIAATERTRANDVERLRDAVTSATDDLVARIEATRAQLDGGAS